MADIEFKIDQYGADFLLLKSEKGLDLRMLGKAIFERKFDFIEEVIVTEQEICLKLNEHFESHHISLIKETKPSILLKPRKYKLPIFFNDHEDWANVTKHSGMKKNEVIKKLLKSKLSLSMFGFLPGFMYIDGLDTSLQIPRKTIPSKYVEAKSIALGGKYLGLYAINSPGGWNVIGKTPLSILDLKTLPPVKVNLGDQVVLESIDEDTYQKLTKKKMNLNTYNQ